MCQAKSVLAVLYGKLFERYCIDVIVAGGSFSVRDLHSGKTRTVVFKSCTGVMDLTSPEKIMQSDGKLYTPKSMIHTAIDFVLWTANALRLFNTTSNTNHGVIMDGFDGKSGVYRFVSRFPSGHYRKEFYFPVPSERFDYMRYPKLQWKESNPKMTATVTRPTEAEKQAFQKLFKFYAISIPIGKRMYSSRRRIV